MHDSGSSGVGGRLPTAAPVEDRLLQLVDAGPEPAGWRVLLADLAERLEREVLLRYERPRPRLTVVRGGPEA